MFKKCSLSRRSIIVNKRCVKSCEILCLTKEDYKVEKMTMMSNGANSSDQNNSLLYSPDRIRIFVENPLQNTNVMHIKMKMPPKVYCMRINRASVSMAQLFSLISTRIRLDCATRRIVGISLALNLAEIDQPSLLENNDTIKIHLETVYGGLKPL